MLQIALENLFFNNDQFNVHISQYSVCLNIQNYVAKNISK